MQLTKGAERLLSSTRGVLPEFLVSIGARPCPSWQRQSCLFPNSIMTLAWHHLWDNLLRRALHMHKWWPLLLSRIKAIVYVIRDHNFRRCVIRSFRDRGLCGLVDLVKAAQLPNFASC